MVGGRLGLSVAIGLTSLFVACSTDGGNCEQLHFEALDSAGIESIRLFHTTGPEDSSTLIASISTESQIALIHSFLKSRRNDWTVPIFGVPVGPNRIVFYDGEERLSSVSFGNTFFEGQGCGYFFSKDVPRNEINSLIEMFGVADHSLLGFSD